MTYQNESEFERLLGHFKALTPRDRVLEIGSLHGETLKRWMPEMAVGGTIVSVDMLVPGADPRYRLQKDGHQVLWQEAANRCGLKLYILDDDSRDPHTVEMVKSLLPNLDFLFIDGGHDYETCLSDWQNYGPMVRNGGMVAFHDLGREWPDVRRVWEQARTGCSSEELVVSDNQFGIGVLWK